VTGLSTRLLCSSPINRIDGDRSVAAAFSMEEFTRLAADAGLSGATLERHWLMRVLLLWQPAQSPVERAVESPVAVAS
jgi:hypothetical protein